MFELNDGSSEERGFSSLPLFSVFAIFCLGERAMIFESAADDRRSFRITGDMGDRSFAPLADLFNSFSAASYFRLVRLS
jgi:hypothetical protein